MKKGSTLILLSVILAVFVPMMFTQSCANTSMAPTGGPKDTIPPYITDIIPYPGATSFPLEGAKIYVLFNEYVTVKNQANIFLSPPLQKAPKSKVRGKGVEIWFEEPLLPNTTYNLSFVEAIADNNEGNMFPGYNYVFSTGEKIDSMLITGTVLDCETLAPVKEATVMLYKDQSDSAIFLQRPVAAAKTDVWGYFTIPYLQDTVYRLYAIKDATSNNIYDPDADMVAFESEPVRPVMVVNDSLPELQAYLPDDTLGCLARKSEYELLMFREKPSKQFVKDRKLIDDRHAYISFNAQNAWIDTLWVDGYPADRIITQFNRSQDSLEIWLNDRRTPDTVRVNLHYRKTDSLGILAPFHDKYKLTVEGGKRKNPYSRTPAADLKHEDTICVYTLSAAPELVEQYGYTLEFKYPVVKAAFDRIDFKYINPKQKEFKGSLRVEADSMNLRVFHLFPEVKMQKGFDYIVKVPEGCFVDITGFRCDSLESKVNLPTDEKLSNLGLTVTNVDGKYIVDLLNEKRELIRGFEIDRDTHLLFPYMSEGRYYIRISSDVNRNGLVDTGNLLEHKQPEKVRFYKQGENDYIDIPEGSEIEQNIDLKEIFGK